jgi:hypothetical protein
MLLSSLNEYEVIKSVSAGTCLDSYGVDSLIANPGFSFTAGTHKI